MSPSTSMILGRGGRGGYFHQNRTWMCLPNLENLTFSIPIFCPCSHPSVYHVRKKAPNFDQIGCFIISEAGNEIIRHHKMVSCSPPIGHRALTELPWIQTDSSWHRVKLVFLFTVMIFKHLNLKLFTVMTVHDRVKESFESTVLQKLCFGFLQGFITSQACPGQACV